MSNQLWRTRHYTNSLGPVMDRLLERAFTPWTAGDSAAGGSTGYHSLPVNVWQTEAAYHAALMAPGLDEQSIDVTFHDDTLAIEGTLTVQAPEGATVVWQEFHQGPARFRRALRLGAAVDASKVEAVYRNGLLLLTMPKVENAKPRQIQVNVSSGDKE